MLSHLWSTAGLSGHDPTTAHGPICACARRGRRMSHPQGVGPGRLREELALGPRESGPGTRRAAPSRERAPWPRHPTRRCMPSAGLEGSCRGDCAGYKFHRLVVRDSVRGSSNQVLKRTAAVAGGSSGRWSRGRLTLIVRPHW